MSRESASWIDRQRIQPFILAGGLSSRFGQDKSRVSIDGQLQIDRLSAALQSDVRCLPIVIVRDENGTFVEDEATIRDSMPSHGPICGLATGLGHLVAKGREQHQRDWALFVPCDHFGWTSRITDMLIGEPIEPDVCVIAFESQSHVQPFPSLWYVGTADMATKAALSQDRSITRLIRSIAGSLLRPLESELDIASFNTRDELDSLLKSRDRE